MNKLIKLFVLGLLSGALFAPAAQAESFDWADERTIAIDTRSYLVVTNQSDILPIAYSTNNWGDAKGCVKVKVGCLNTPDVVVAITNENGYAKWMPKREKYGEYIMQQYWYDSNGEPLQSGDAVTIVYSTYSPLRWTSSVGGTVTAAYAGKALTSGDAVLGYEGVDFTAVPTLTGTEHYEFVRWSATTNGVALPATAFTNETTLVTSFEMPCVPATVTGSFQWKSNFNSTVFVKKDELWKIYPGEKYSGLVASNGTSVAISDAVAGANLNSVTIKDGATFVWDFRNGGRPYLDKISAIKFKDGAKRGIFFDVTLTNGTYKIASGISDYDGKVFDVSFGTEKVTVTVGDEDWTFVGNKRVQLMTDKDGSLLFAVTLGTRQSVVIDADAEGTFEWNGRKWTVGVNAFRSFTDLFTNETYVIGATNVHVFGLQTIASKPPMSLKWDLDLVTSTNAEGEVIESIVSVGKESGTDSLVNITNNLGKITGDGVIVLEALETEVPPTIYAPYRASKDVKITNSYVEIGRFKGSDDIEVNVDEKARQTKGLVIVPGIENLTGDVSFAVETNAPGDVLIAGTLIVPNGQVKISNESTNILELAGKVMGREVYVWNYGPDAPVAEEPVMAAAEIVATENITIDNAGHLEANVTAGGDLWVHNGDGARTLVGSYAGKTISLYGAVNGTISNATFASSGAVTLKGINTLTGPFAIEAPDGLVTNFGYLVWDVRSANHTVTLAGFDAIVQKGPEDDSLRILLDAQQELGTYVLATDASEADDLTFRCYGGSGSFKLEVNGDMVIRSANERVYSLATDADGQLVLTVRDLKAHFVETACSVQEGAETTVSVFGGSATKASQITLSYVKGSGAYTTAYLNGQRVSFPLTLVWEKGDISVKDLVFRTAYSKRAEGDKYFTLQLAGEVGTEILEGKDVCAVRIIDREGGDEADYVRALVYPANGGKVSGAGALKRDASGEIASTRTLAVTPNTFATFAGWYAAKKDNPNEIDFDNELSRERKLTVGKGTELEGGTYFAYFTDVLPVAAVVEPTPFDAEGRPLPGVEGVTGWSRIVGTYGTMVGVKFALPVEIEDASEAGKLTIKGLPAGLKYNAKAGRIEGVPTKKGGWTAMFVAKNAAGSQTVAYRFYVYDLPPCAIGTFNGVINDVTNRASVGSVTFTAGKTGALSAKVTRRLSGTRSFSVKGYDYIDENTLGVEMANNAGDVFEATLSLTNDLYEAVLVGTAGGLGGKLWENEEDDGTFRAVSNVSAEDAYVGTYDETLSVPTTNGVDVIGSVQYRVKENGSVTIKAKMPGQTFSGTAAGAFRLLTSTARGIEAALRSGKSIWSTDVKLFGGDEKSAVGQARYIRGEDLDDDQLVGEEPEL